MEAGFREPSAVTDSPFVVVKRSPRLVSCIAVLWCSLLVGSVGSIRPAPFNLYLQAHESRRLFGLNVELYYVKEGKRNEYALGFVVPVPANVTVLEFTWQSPRAPLPYVLAITASDTEALATPRVNVSRRGTLPLMPEVFRIELPCTGLRSAEVDVRITLNVTVAPSNVTSVTLVRKKICIKDDSINRKMTMGACIEGSSLSCVGNVGAVSDIPVPPLARTSPTLVAIACATATVLIVSLVALVYYLRSHKARQNQALRYPSSPGTTPPPFLRVNRIGSVHGGSVLSYSSFRRLSPLSTSSAFASPANERDALGVSEQLSEVAVDRRKVTLLEKLQEGTFGQIYHGLMVEDSCEVGAEQNVFVKTVTDAASASQRSLLLSEGSMLFGMNHANVLPLIAACTEGGHQPLLLYPYMNEGNLKRFLQTCKFSPDGQCHVLVTRDLVDMAIQIAEGIMYLHKRKFIHKDIGTRNCVVDDELHVKVTDSALSRDVFPNDYHCLGDNENRPVKWLAPESLLAREFSPSSDLWMYGVTLWELLTLGQQPYQEIDAFEIAAYLGDGYRLVQPINCPDPLFRVMEVCWRYNPEERPSFAALLRLLAEFYTTLGCFI